MDLDTNELKRILESIKDGQFFVGNDVLNIDPCGFDLKKCIIYDRDRDNEMNKAIYHLKILIETKLVDGNLKKGVDTTNFSINSLTLKGHQFLEALDNDSILEKIKKSIKSITVGTIEKVPALAIGAILASALK